jgi:hypothetical protein
VQITEGLQLAADRDGHLIAARIEVGEHQQHHRAAIVGADLGHLIQQGVADLAGRQIEVRVVPIAQRREHVGEARFLAIDHEMIRLACPEVGDADRGLHVLFIRHPDRDAVADVDEGLDRLGPLHLDDRRRVALVGDLVEPDIAEPSGGLGRAALQPEPVLFSVAVGLAIRLHQAAGRDQGIVQTAKMDSALGKSQIDHLLGEP